jgi:hypothetical protein
MCTPSGGRANVPVSGPRHTSAHVPALRRPTSKTTESASFLGSAHLALGRRPRPPPSGRAMVARGFIPWDSPSPCALRPEDGRPHQSPARDTPARMYPPSAVLSVKLLSRRASWVPVTLLSAKGRYCRPAGDGTWPRVERPRGEARRRVTRGTRASSKTRPAGGGGSSVR